MQDPAPHGGPETTPSRSLRRRWLRHLGFSAPIVAALGAVLLVAASFSVMRFVGGGTPMRPDGDAAGAPTRPVPVGRTDVDVDRPVDPALGPAGTAADELRRRGHIGSEDTLASDGREGRLGSRVLTRAQQHHHGVPVFAADVVVTTEGERIIKIHGHTTPDVNLDTTVPVNDYPAALTLAEALLGHAVAPEGDGALVIVPVDDGAHRLAWLGVVVMDQRLERVALDAETGAVLHRVPAVRNVSAGRALLRGDHR